MRILIAEDNRELQRILTDLFHMMNYEVDIAGDGLQVLRLLEDSLPDIVLLDVQLPYMSGLDVLDHIRQETSTQHLKTVLLTGSVQTLLQPQALLADAHLIKPVDFHDLMQVIHRLMKDQPALSA